MSLSQDKSWIEPEARFESALRKTMHCRTRNVPNLSHHSSAKYPSVRTLQPISFRTTLPIKGFYMKGDSSFKILSRIGHDCVTLNGERPTINRNKKTPAEHYLLFGDNVQQRHSDWSHTRLGRGLISGLYRRFS